MPVGCVFAGSMAQLPSNEPESVYLKTLQAAAVHDPERRAVGHDVLGIGVAVSAAGEAETAGRILAAGETAGGAGVLVDLVGVAIHQPDVGAVGGDAGELGRGTQAAGRPGAEQRAAGAVDVDVLVGVDDPFGGAGGVVATPRGLRLFKVKPEGRLLGPRGLILVGRIGPADYRGRVVDHVELGGRVAVGNRWPWPGCWPGSPPPDWRD